MRPTRALSLTLPLVTTLAAAVLAPQAARAQAHLVVERSVLVERINRDLSELARERATQFAPTPTNFFWGGGGSPSDLRNNASQYSLAPEATRLSYPESTVLPTAAAAATTIIIPFLPAFELGASLGGTVTVALSGTYTGFTAFDIAISARNFWEDVPADVDDSSLVDTPAVLDFFYNRLEVHYGLDDPDGVRRDGSCLVFFALGENPDGSHDLHYALDKCRHFPQTVPSGPGDPRIGPDGVDVWDRLLRQNLVVAKGSIPVP